MGVIQRQSIKQSLVNYAAVAIGAISTIFIYPQDKETYGIARFFIDTALMIAPFIMLGFSAVTIRYFPHFKDEKKGHRGFLPFVLMMVGLGSLLFIVLAWMFKDQFFALYEDKGAEIVSYLPYLVPLAIIWAFIQLFFNYSSNFKRIVVPALFQNLIKLTLPVLILLFIWKNIELGGVINGVLLTYVFALLGLIAYVYSLGQLKLKPDFSLLDSERKKDIRTFAFYSLFSSVGSVLAFRIDLFMVPTMMEFKDNGVYAIALFIANAIAIPTNAITQISGPIIAEKLKEGDLSHVKDLYQRSSFNLLLIGLFLFACILASVEDLFSIMPKSEQMQGGLMIVFLIGLAKIIDMGTSVNNQIINYSKHYRFGFYAIILMAAFNIGANLIFIPKMGIIGAALATLLSLSIYNLAKMIFIKWQFKMQPFILKTLWLLLIASIAFCFAWFMPVTGIAVADIMLRSVLISVVYGISIWYFDLAPEAIAMIRNKLPF